MCTIGLVIQTGSISAVYSGDSSSGGFDFTMYCLSVIFYSVAWFVCFYAYREFAAMLLDSSGQGGQSMGIPGFGG